MTLDALLAELRAELRDEVPVKLHAGAPDGGRHTSGGAAEPDPEDEPTHRPTEKYYQPGMTGLAFGRAFERYIGHSDHYGLGRLAMLSIIEVSDWCASVHPVHRRPLFTRTLCSQLVFEAAYLGQELPDLVWLHPELDIHQLVGMLEKALFHAAEWRANKFAQWSKVPGEDAPLPERRPYRPAA